MKKSARFSVFSFEKGGCSAFSLIELLVVISIMAIVLSLTLPAFNRVTGGLDMTRAADTLVSQLAQARQTAIARNCNVEVRLYSYNEGADGDRYHAMQSFLATDDPAQPWHPLGRVQKLPPSICIDSGATLSPLIGTQSPKTGAEAGSTIPGVGTAYNYVAITLRPDGTALPSVANGMFVTIKESRLNDPSSQLPANYAIVQIFSDTGLIRSYRP